MSNGWGIKAPYKCRFNEIFKGVELKPFFIDKDPFTYCSVFVQDGGRPYVGVGFAKRNVRDLPSQRIGRHVAYGRALKDLVESMGGEERALRLAEALRKEFPRVENSQERAA